MPKAFTLIELLIWMAVFGILTTVSVSNFRAGTRNDSVRQASAQVAGQLRLAQNMTLSGAVLGDIFPAGGWGVRFVTSEPNKIILFADTNGDHNYNTGEEIENETLTLPGKAVFSLSTDLNVLFTAPEGIIYFNGTASPDIKDILVQATGAAITHTVKIYRISGQVRVE